MTPLEIVFLIGVAGATVAAGLMWGGGGLAIYSLLLVVGSAWAMTP